MTTKTQKTSPRANWLWRFVGLVRLFFGDPLRRSFARRIRAARSARDRQAAHSHHHDFYAFRAKYLRDLSRFRCLPNAQDQRGA
jgi:hypothetical protein